MHVHMHTMSTDTDTTDTHTQLCIQQQQQQQQLCTVRLCGSSCSLCGYCSGKRAALVSRSRNDSSKSYGMLIPSSNSSHLASEDYYKLVHRGWRRSGQHLYKPDNWDSCCPALTIRLPVTKFVPTKSQRRVLRKMHRALEGGTNNNNTLTKTKIPANKKLKRETHAMHTDSLPILKQLAEWTQSALQDITQQPSLPQPVHYKITSSEGDSMTAISTICAAVAGPSKGNYNRGVLAHQVVERLQSKSNTCNVEAHETSGQIICTISKQQMNGHHFESNGVSVPMETEAPIDDLLYDWFRNHCPQKQIKQPYNLQITTHPALESSLAPDVHQLYFEYQQKVHNDAPPLSDQEEADWGDATPDFVAKAQIMLRTTYSDLTPTESSRMTASFSSFYRFLVDTPLSTDEPKTGTFHQHYRINGTLIAVGVVDILAEGLSSVYAFYHAAFAHSLCPLGKFMILKEIDYCREQELPYYYLGYYIHSCGKMRYKADYHPSQLLCPSTLQWVDAQEGQMTLDKESPERHCCRLFLGEVARDETDETTIMESISLHVGLPDLVTLNMLHPNGQEIVRPLVQEFVEHVGPEVSRHCVLKLV